MGVSNIPEVPQFSPLPTYFLCPLTTVVPLYPPHSHVLQYSPLAIRAPPLAISTPLLQYFCLTAMLPFAPPHPQYHLPPPCLAGLPTVLRSLLWLLWPRTSHRPSGLPAAPGLLPGRHGHVRLQLRGAPEEVGARPRSCGSKGLGHLPICKGVCVAEGPVCPPGWPRTQAAAWLEPRMRATPSAGASSVPGTTSLGTLRLLRARRLPLSTAFG